MQDKKNSRYKKDKTAQKLPDISSIPDKNLI